MVSTSNQNHVAHGLILPFVRYLRTRGEVTGKVKPTAVQCRRVMLFLARTLSGSLNKSWVDNRNQASVSPIYRLQIFFGAIGRSGWCPFADATCSGTGMKTQHPKTRCGSLTRTRRSVHVLRRVLQDAPNCLEHIGASGRRLSIWLVV
jgi:hypothetical protein